jgi:cob(I)alamin adenosyltransferase
MKIYTKTGDDGSTGLIGGKRVSKSDPRIDCYGTIDELNAAIGLCAASAAEQALGRLRSVQNELFVIGSLLATPDGKAPGDMPLPQLDPRSIDRLEGEIDAAQAELPPLRNFILPGGCELAVRLHLARTVCRRAERLLVALAEDGPARVDPLLVRYLNRLSDWLFVQARLANRVLGIEDVPWNP